MYHWEMHSSRSLSSYRKWFPVAFGIVGIFIRKTHKELYFHMVLRRLKICPFQVHLDLLSYPGWRAATKERSPQPLTGRLFSLPHVFPICRQLQCFSSRSLQIAVFLGQSLGMNRAILKANPTPHPQAPLKKTPLQQRWQKALLSCGRTSHSSLFKDYFIFLFFKRNTKHTYLSFIFEP